MSIPGAHAASISALHSQSQYLEALSSNVSNLSTAGYKRTDIQFSTVMGDTSGQFLGKQSFVRPLSSVRVDIDGQLENGGDKDLAIKGPGFFAMAPIVDGAPDLQNVSFRRNGQFIESVIDNQSYITDSSRTHILLAWPVAESGDFSVVTDPSSLSPVQFDSSQIVSPAQATSQVLLGDRLPATAVGSEIFNNSTGLVIDSAGNKHNLAFEWEKDPTLLRWNLTISSAEATPSTLATLVVDFDSSGNVTSPAPATSIFTPDWNNGVAGSQITVNFSNTKHTGATFAAQGIEVNGILSGNIQSTVFDAEGYLNAKFTNGLSSPLFKIPVATFINPESLLPQDAGFFSLSRDTIDPVMQDVQQLENTEFFDKRFESSNVDLATELAKVLLAQRAYNSASTALRVTNEMEDVVRDLT